MSYFCSNALLTINLILNNMKINKEELIEQFIQLEENCRYLLKIPKTYYPEDLYLEQEFDNKSECVKFIEDLINDIDNDRDLCTDVDHAKMCRYIANNLQTYLNDLIPDTVLLTEVQSYLRSLKSYISGLQDDLTYNEYSIQYIFNKYSKPITN